MKDIKKGKLPISPEVLQIVAASGFKACFKTTEGNEFTPLIAWAFLVDGSLLPLLFNKATRTYISAYAVAGFVEIVHDDYLEEEVDEDDDIFYEEDESDDEPF